MGKSSQNIMVPELKRNSYLICLILASYVNIFFKKEEKIWKKKYPWLVSLILIKLYSWIVPRHLPYSGFIRGHRLESGLYMFLL